MNRLYILTVGSLEIQGLISPGELPDLKYEFDSISRSYGATADCWQNELIAEKDGVQVRLSIGSRCGSMPGKQVLEACSQMMREAFL